MGIVLIPKKKLGIFIMVMGLALVLISASRFFSENLKYTSLLQNSIKALKAYYSEDTNISYKLPERWSTKQEKFSGGEVLYHNSFISEDGSLHGFVQVWNLNQGLKNFLAESKKISEKENKVKDYELTALRFKDMTGFRLSYSMETKNKNNYKAYEYFIEDNERFIRFAFYVKEADFKENLPANYEAIVRTLSIQN